MNTLGSTWWRSPGWPNPYWVTSNKSYLGIGASGHTHKVSEMLRPSATPIMATGTRNLSPSLGSYPFRYLPYSYRSSLGASPETAQSIANAMANASGTIITPATPGGTMAQAAVPQSTPKWFDSNGNTITSAACGQAYGFTIPGFEGRQVYLVQTKNGQAQFSGLFSIPMASYSSICNQDEGNYVATAYDPATGQQIGSGAFTVSPSGANPAAASQPVITGVPLSPGTTAQPVQAAPGVMTDITSFLSGVTMNEWLAIGGVALALIYLRSRS